MERARLAAVEPQNLELMCNAMCIALPASTNALNRLPGKRRDCGRLADPLLYWAEHQGQGLRQSTVSTSSRYA